ncbi:SDR family oxidoreductase [Methylobacillus arboreus]|uniref:SDR family oxidoreductase n=1 Tax=Methylobacillus arboreus TaxID=755170 RepID=UPI001E460E51|nr:SDR family oxidoreductase [Methylobacillus arboreus]MCB5189191.1 SDR family oxidoreductase [Methylobacillus arboreus]
MSRVLIAGCGDLGLELARRLVAAGHEVTGLRRSAHPMPDGVQIALADVTRPETLKSLAAIQPELLVYCVSASEHSDENYRLSYVEGLRNALAALQDVPLRHVFFVSSTGVYGQETQALLDEDNPAIASDFTGQRMLEAEALLDAYPSSILRFSGIYGPGRTRMITLAQKPQQWPARNGWTNRIHRDDGAAFITYLIQQLEHKVPERLYIVTDNQPLPVYDLLQWLAAKQGVETAAIEIPLAGGNKRLSNQRMLASGYQFIYPDYESGYSALLEAMS